MAQGRRAAEGSAATQPRILFTRDGVSELCDHLLTDRHLQTGKEGREGRRKEGNTEGKDKEKEGCHRHKEVGRQQNKTVVRQDVKRKGGKKRKQIERRSKKLKEQGRNTPETDPVKHGKPKSHKKSEGTEINK